ncbi:MAG: hypothetical protein WCK63_15595 [Betaproteobacteria bacterium]
MGTMMDYRVALSGDKKMMLQVAANLAKASGFCFDIEEFERSGCYEQSESDCEFDVRWCGSGDTAVLEVHLYVKSRTPTEDAFNEVLLAVSAAGMSVKYLEWTDDQGWWTKCVGYENGEREEYLADGDLFIPDWNLARDAGLTLAGDPLALDRLLDAFVSPEFDDESYDPARVGLAEIIREAGVLPRPEHAKTWMKWAKECRSRADDEDDELSDMLQDREDLIDWMQSMARRVALSAKQNPAGKSARVSAAL